jgi:DNA (cytosine-5)-methyltransferase 1
VVLINGLDLFSGIGGLTLALSEWVSPITYCEKDRYAQAVLLSRQRDGSLPTAPIWDDIETLSAGFLPSEIDIIYGGFPCQDISSQGNGRGLEGERSGLVFEMLRLIREIRPTFVFMENVPTLRTSGAERVGQELAALGYDCRWDTLSAYDVGAPHKRERWFLLGYNSNSTDDGEIKEVPRRQNTDAERAGWWDTEPKMDRMADGIPFRVDRNKCLGNSVVPDQAKEAFRRLMGL